MPDLPQRTCTCMLSGMLLAVHMQGEARSSYRDSLLNPICSIAGPYLMLSMFLDNSRSK